MKIALIIPSIAGVKAFFIPLLNQAKEKGIQLTVITSKDNRGFAWPGELPAGIHYHFIDFPTGLNPFRLLSAVREIGRYVRRGNYDLVHAHFTLGVVILSLLKVRARKWGTFHGVFHLVDKGWRSVLIGRLEKRAIHKMDKVFVLNDRDYQALRNFSHVEKVPMPGMGVDLQRFNLNKFNRVNRAEARQKFGLPPEARVLLYVGRYTRFKGFEDVLRLHRMLISKGEDVHLLLCGKADPSHPLHSHIDNSKVMDLGWRQDIPAIMHLADCLVFPSQREGLPVSLMEAIAMHLPYVAYQVRGVEDVHAALGGGRLCPPGNLEALYSAVVTILNHPPADTPSEETMSHLSRHHYTTYQFQQYKSSHSPFVLRTS